MRKTFGSFLVFIVLLAITGCGDSGQGSVPEQLAESTLPATNQVGADENGLASTKPAPVKEVVKATESPSLTPRSTEKLKDPAQNTPVPATAVESAFFDAVARSFPGLSSLPDCGLNTQLTVAPLADDAYSVILPLGLLSTPQWVLPSTHVYYQLVRESPSTGGYGPPAVADVRAPGDIRILRVDSSESIGGPQGDYLDYEITFAPCRTRMYKLLHVSTLVPDLADVFEAAADDDCTEYGSATAQYRLCEKLLNVDITVGSIIGTTGGKVSSALDLEAYDLAGPSLPYANPARFRPDGDLRLKIVCPFDDFSGGLRESQLARLGGESQLRTLEPRCGESMQDIPGTAQGNWYTGEPGAHSDWSQQLGLLHDHIDPGMAAISIGGKVMDHGVWNFRPESSGLVNRDFSDISADGKTYCFQGALKKQGSQTPTLFPGRLLVALNSATEMLVEQQDGGCSDNPVLIDPVAYQR